MEQDDSTQVYGDSDNDDDDDDDDDGGGGGDGAPREHELLYWNSREGSVYGSPPDSRAPSPVPPMASPNKMYGPDAPEDDASEGDSD
jgi:hypothetical protein